MTTLLTDNLPLLAGASNGIKKLRELILELAVRGKLLPQDANDEAASELLKRIAKEKALLEVAGQIRKQKPLPNITEEDQPFELPAGWVWTHLADIAFSQAGFAFKSNGFNQAGLGLPLIRIRDVGQAFSGTYYEGDYRPEFLVQRGDYLISMDGEFRVAAWEGDASLLNQRVSRLVFFGTETTRRFIAVSLQARLLELQGIKSYTTVDHLSGGQISESVIALPPLAEQHRIVAKVDELMALCDRLETQQADAASAHAQLVQALLGSLTQASDATEFAANWQRLAEHFHTLFSTEPSIDALKQTLLQLAVMGKLVPQDPADESASELLKRIQAEKHRLMAEGKLKKQKPLTAITEDEELFSVPQNWMWARMSSFSELKSGFAYKSETFSDSGDNQVIRMGNVRPGLLRLDANPAFIADALARETSDCELSAGDIVLTMTGTKGKQDYMYSVLIDDKHLARGRLYLNQRLCIVKAHLVNTSFLSLILKDERLLDPIFTSSTGTANQANIGMGALGAWALPLPPLAEQQRIVAKVDELMALCDQLKTQLSQARQVNEQLASTLVEQAVA